MSSGLRETSKTGIRLRHPEYTEEQVHYAAIRLSLGNELFKKAYPHIDAPLNDHPMRVGRVSFLQLHQQTR